MKTLIFGLEVNFRALKCSPSAHFLHTGENLAIWTQTVGFHLWGFVLTDMILGKIMNLFYVFTLESKNNGNIYPQDLR